MPNSSFKDRTPQMCDICGAAYEKLPFVELVDDKYIQYCHRCSQYLHNCITCAHLPNECKFETDPSPLPKQVQKTVQMGPVQQITIIRNPERMAVTCPGCICYENSECTQEKVACGETYCEKHKLITSPRKSIRR